MRFCQISNSLFLVIAMLGMLGIDSAQGQEFENNGARELNELLDIHLENAKSFRNYDVRIQQTMSFEPVVADARFHAFTSISNQRIIMDWDRDRCIKILYSYEETAQLSSRSNEIFAFECFENGVWTKRGIANPSRPFVQNVSFPSFLRQAQIPMTEVVGLQTFPGHFYQPFEQSHAAAKKSSLASFRRLQDGTGVRTVKSGEDVSVTHFDRLTMMPSFLSSKPKKSRPLSQSVRYELKEGVYRPVEISLKRSTFITDPSKAMDGTDIVYFDGSGTITYVWNSFNEEEPVFPSDKSLTTSRESWLSLIEGK